MQVICKYPKLFILFCILSLFSHDTKAQAIKPDSSLVFSFLNKAEILLGAKNYDSALANCNAAMAISKQKNYLPGQAWSSIKITDILIKKGDYPNAAGFPLQTEQLGRKLKDSLIVAISFMHRAQLKMYNNQLDEAIELFQRAFRVKLDKVKSTYTALAYNDLGFTYGQKADYKKDADNLLKALNLYEQLKDDGSAAMVLSNLASLYDALGEKQKAIEYEKKAIARRDETDMEGLTIGYCALCQFYMQSGDLKEATHYQELCLKYSKQSKIESREVLGYITSGLLANAKGDNVTSFQLEKKVIEILEKSHSNDAMLAKRYIAAAIGSGNMHEDSLLTLGYFNKAMELSQKLNIRDNLQLIYYYRTVFFKTHKDYFSAYENYKKYISYKDSINAEETKRTVAELETKYQTEKKDNEITRLNAQQTVKQLEIDKQRAVIAGDFLQAQKKQGEIDLLAKNRELLDVKIKQQDDALQKNLLIAKNNEQALKLSEQDKQLKDRQIASQRIFRNIMLAGVVFLTVLALVLFNRYQLKKKLEQQYLLLHVRNDIARDLHDEIGSTLSSIKILSEVSRNNLEKDTQKASGLLQKITDQSTQMQQSMSDIVWAIKPDNDKLGNMLVRMREYASHALESKNIKPIFTVNEKLLAENLNMHQRRDLFLIFKEAVNNAAKYSEATEVNVLLNNEDKDIVLQVQDNGQGFAVSTSSMGNGLKNIKARATSLGGVAQIISIPRKGTTVTVKIPAT